MKKMNNIFKYTIIALICFVSLVIKVQAEECSAVDTNEIKSKASNVRINYVPGTKDVKTKDYDEREVDMLTRYVDIKVFNISSDLFIRIRSSSDNIKFEEQLLDYHNLGPDGSITVRVPALDVVQEYTFEVFSYSDNCKGEIIRTIRLTVPKYNPYSQLDICSDIKEFYLCQEYITFDINKDKFFEQVNNYKENGAANADVLMDQASTLNKIVASSSKTKYIIVGLLLVGGSIATYFIIKDNRKKNQIWK